MSGSVHPAGSCPPHDSHTQIKQTQEVPNGITNSGNNCLPKPLAKQTRTSTARGATRDADVLANSSLVPVLAACPLEAALRGLKLGASALAAQKRRQAANAVASARCSRPTLSLAERQQASRWQASINQPALHVLVEPLAKHVEQILDGCHEQLLKRSKRLLVPGTPEQPHRVRIAAKQARYATEFLLSLHPRAPVKRGLRRLTALQDQRGKLNDMAVADRLLLEIGARRPERAGAASFARGYLCAAARQELPVLARQWKQFRAVAPT